MCTDKKCVWSAPHKSAPEKYDMRPSLEYNCFQEKLKNDEAKKKMKTSNLDNSDTNTLTVEKADETAEYEEEFHKIMIKKKSSKLSLALYMQIIFRFNYF